MDNRSAKTRMFVSWSRIMCFAVLALIANASTASTGDPVVDAMLVPINVHVVGNAVANRFNNGSNILNCDSSAAPALEQKCPNDSTYTPVVSTGGYSAWGVGLEPLTAVEWGTDCYLVPVVVIAGSNVSWNFEFVCESGWNEIPALTFGKAAMRNRWGTSSSSASSVSPYISTLAFKGSDLAECITEHTGLDSLCGPLVSPTPNRTFVQDAGYETEVVVDDPTCNMPSWLANKRTGTTTDFQYGCFSVISASWMSDLPSPYMETNIGDGELTFITGIGSADPASIDEGVTYDSEVIFYSNGNYVGALGMSAEPFGTITHYEPFTPVCLIAGTPNLCYYSVDSRPIANSEEFTW